MNAKETFKIAFPDWYDERGEWETNEKGWLQGVEVRFANGDVHPLFFYDPVRLAQDLETDVKHGRPFVAHPSMIVIPEITREAILEVVEMLVNDGFFPSS
jgi:hypothetical protein